MNDILPHDFLVIKLLSALEHAKHEQVLYEFVDAVLVDYKYSNDIISAIDYANREWDL